MATGGKRVPADEALVHVLEHKIKENVMTGLDAAIDQAIKRAVKSAIVSAVATEPQPAPKLARPAAGGRCAAVWETLDKLTADGKPLPTLNDMRKIGRRRRWNENNTRIEYYRWRRNNGITRAAAHV
jgi:hypothetical protein